MLEWHRCCCSSQIYSVLIWPAGGKDRRGGPVLTFPARSNHDRIRQEDLRRLIAYLAGIPRYAVCQCEHYYATKFVVVIDSGSGSWNIEGLIPWQYRCGNQPAALVVKLPFTRHCVHPSCSMKYRPAVDLFLAISFQISHSIKMRSRLCLSHFQWQNQRNQSFH